jgi:hypothetical protein
MHIFECWLLVYRCVKMKWDAFFHEEIWHFGICKVVVRHVLLWSCVPELFACTTRTQSDSMITFARCTYVEVGLSIILDAKKPSWLDSTFTGCYGHTCRRDAMDTTYFCRAFGVRVASCRCNLHSCRKIESVAEVDISIDNVIFGNSLDALAYSRSFGENCSPFSINFTRMSTEKKNAPERVDKSQLWRTSSKSLIRPCYHSCSSFGTEMWTCFIVKELEIRSAVNTWGPPDKFHRLRTSHRLQSSLVLPQDMWKKAIQKVFHSARSKKKLRRL